MLQFETEMASSHLSRTLSRDPEITYNKMSLPALTKLCTPTPSWASYLAKGVGNEKPYFDWTRYFALIGKPAAEIGDINIATVDAIRKSTSMLTSSCVRHYLKFHCVNSHAQHLSTAFTAAYIELHEKVLKGTVEQRPRWKRVLEALEVNIVTYIVIALFMILFTYFIFHKLG